MSSDPELQRAQRQAEMISDIIGITDVKKRAHIGDLIYRFNLKELGISELKLCFDEIHAALFYAFFFYERSW